jgi:restriction system protein
MQINVDELIDHYNIPLVKINENRNYWLVRTQSGEYHQEFYFDNYIGIGWNEFNDSGDFDEKINEDYMKKQIHKKYPDAGRPGLIYGQIKRFFFEMKVGDIIMIPTQKSSHISFGIIDSEPYIKEIPDEDIELGQCPFEKRRDVKWIKTVGRSDLDPYLYKMMNSQLTINRANDYDDFIDRTLHSFYVKGDTAHLVFNVNTTEKIPAPDLMDFINRVVDLVPELNKISDEFDFDKRDLDIKLNVQSPGVIEFFADPSVIIGAGLLLTAVVGGTFRMTFTKEETSGEASSEGLLGRILQYKKHKDENELKKMEQEHKQSMERIQAELPEELKSLQDPKSKDPEG